MKGELQNDRQAIQWATDYHLKATAHPGTIYIQGLRYSGSHGERTNLLAANKIGYFGRGIGFKDVLVFSHQLLVIIASLALADETLPGKRCGAIHARREGFDKVVGFCDLEDWGNIKLGLETLLNSPSIGGPRSRNVLKFVLLQSRTVIKEVSKLILSKFKG
ncbi:hypothetical protein DVH24_019600 [Malus domestica]|uniref:Uncharacterized protein n=1 Tax=Malus domestica TaxID=3750 RepID=A0A498I387_MALDO|nr:hypothetical protein DVH24_019600 [Malus domestica]